MQLDVSAKREQGASRGGHRGVGRTERTYLGANAGSETAAVLAQEMLDGK